MIQHCQQSWHFWWSWSSAG